VSVPALLKMLHPPALWGKGETAVLYAFVDGSGTHAASRVVAIAGFVANDSGWADFDTRWQAVLDDRQWPSRPSELHMFECAHGDGEYLENRWLYAQRLALYGDLCRVIVNSRMRPIAASVITECFHQIPPSDLALLQQPNVRLGTPLDVAFQMLTQQILGAVHSVDTTEEVSVVFDKDDKGREENFADFCQHYANDYLHGDVFSGIAFMDSKKFTPLQAADLLAYGTLHLAQRSHYPSEAEPHFPIIPAFWKMLLRLAENRDTSPYGTICNLQTLTALVEKVKRGEMIPKRGAAR
jgi:Protein of unknown function (DUF3800)